MKRSKNKNSKSYIKWRTRVDYRNALKIWSTQVQKRDENRCVICGKTQNIQSHHILDKRYYKELSLDVNVGITLCVQHHKWGKFAAHTNALWFSLWLQKNRPDQHKWCSDRIKRTCMSCSGTGITINNGNLCHKCNGFGTIL